MPRRTLQIAPAMLYTRYHHVSARLRRGLVSALLLVLALGAGTPVLAQSLGPSVNFSLVGGSAVEVDGVRYYDAAVHIAAGAAGTKLDGALVYLYYNTALFGTDAAAAGGVSVGAGSLISSYGYSIGVADNDDNRLAITLGIGTPGTGATVPSGGSGELITLRLRIADGGSGEMPVGLSFDTALMAYEQYHSGGNIYDPVTASGSDNSMVQAGSSSLPVELTGLDALVQGASVVLRWTTASERDNAGFEVERAVEADGVVGTFESAGFVNGAGTTAEAKAYTFTVRDLSAGTHVFRLKQVDVDGAETYSDEVRAVVAPRDPFALTEPYPNPFNPETQFELVLQRTQQVRVDVYNVLGQRVANLFDGLAEGGRHHAIRFQADHLPSGAYYITAIGEDVKATKRVTLVK